MNPFAATSSIRERFTEFQTETRRTHELNRTVADLFCRQQSLMSEMQANVALKRDITAQIGGLRALMAEYSAAFLEHSQSTARLGQIASQLHELL